MTTKVYLTIFLSLIIIVISKFGFAQKNENKQFVTYIVNPQKQNIKLYWKNDQQILFKNIQNVKIWLDSKHTELLFAMNAGMYKEDNSPLGLYIENQKVIAPLNISNGYGNFYLQPNGVFYITTNNQAGICVTKKFNKNNKIKYATQSGPMLVINGQINEVFKKGSINLNIRNGVGLLPDNKIVFVMSKQEINFYDFAYYFKSLGCKNALYLDGFVSRTYLPEQNWVQTDGNFGVLIGVTK